MTGIYRVDPNKLSDYKDHLIILLFRKFSIVLLIFVILIVAENSDSMYELITIITLFTYIPIVLYWLIRPASPFETTIIELKNDKVIREGEGLSRVEIPLKDIGTVIKQPNGIAVVKADLASVVNLYTSKFAYTSSSNILFIPTMTDRYEDIKQYLHKLSKEDTRYTL